MKNKKLLALVGVISFSLIGGVACNSTTQEDTKEQQTQEQSQDVKTVKVTDGKGEVEVKTNPKTIVSFDYGVIDALDKMGIEVAGLPKASVPKSLAKYEDEKYADLGDLKEPDFEAINNLNPDLIIISGRQADMYDEFNKIAPTLYLDIDGSNYVEDFSRNMEALGKVFEKEVEFNSEVDRLNKEMEEVNKKVTENKSNGLAVMVNKGNLSVFSPESRFGILYNQLGFECKDSNIDASTHGQQVTFEYLSQQNPEYIFVVDRGDATGGESTAKALFDNDLVKSTDAYKNGKIVYLSSQAWYTVSGGINSTQTMIDDVKNAIK